MLAGTSAHFAFQDRKLLGEHRSISLCYAAIRAPYLDSRLPSRCSLRLRDGTFRFGKKSEDVHHR